jgi:predicted enzyme related to lactoylglutathione lyase
MLQNAPMYSYLPAKDVARARAFYEGKVGFKPKEVTPGGVVYEFANGTSKAAKPSGRSRTSKRRWQS